MAGGPRRPRDGRPGRARGGGRDVAAGPAGLEGQVAAPAGAASMGGASAIAGPAAGQCRAALRARRRPSVRPAARASARRAGQAGHVAPGGPGGPADRADRADLAGRAGDRGEAAASGRMAPAAPRADDGRGDAGSARHAAAAHSARLDGDHRIRAHPDRGRGSRVRRTADRDRTPARGHRPFGRRDGPPARRGSEAPPLEEGEELVAGRRPVEEAFAAGRPARRLLVTPARRQALERIVLHATTLRIPIVEVEGGSLTSLAGFDGHQGVAVVVDARRFASVDDLLARAIERGEPPLVLVLDSLEDPQNVGTLLRSAEAAGVHGVVFPTQRQAPLSPAAVKASAGATEHLLLVPVDDLAGDPHRPPPPRAADRRLGRRGVAHRPRGGPARADRARRRQRGPRALADRPAAVRPVRPAPDARRDRLAQRGRRGVGPPVRGRRSARRRPAARRRSSQATMRRRSRRAETEEPPPAPPAKVAEGARRRRRRRRSAVAKRGKEARSEGEPRRPQPKAGHGAREAQARRTREGRLAASDAQAATERGLA